MKKMLAALLSFTFLFSLAACNSNGASNAGVSSPSEANTQADNPPETTREQNLPVESETPSEILQLETAGGKELVVYFSATGNTKAVAEALAELQSAYLYEIVPEQPYTNEDLNYSDRSTRASVEQNDAAARPAISGSIDNIEDYDVIYVGFPIWWGDMPRILYTFFDTYDLSNKTIAPFCTSGGSGISTAVQSIVELEPSAIVTDGLRANSANETNELMNWLNSIGLTALE